MKDCPCLNCGDRFIGCHGKCEKYKGWRAEYDEEKAEQIKRHNLEYSLDRYTKDVRHRIYRAANHSKKGR